VNKKEKQMRLIMLTQGYFAQVSDHMFEFLNQFKWCYLNGGYAVRRVTIDGKRHIEYMHHYVIGKPLKGFVVDHVDGNGCNNTDENLRIVTSRQNHQNTYKHRAGKLVGASYNKPAKKWGAQIVIGGKHKNLGYFDSELAAHNAYNSYRAVEGL